MTVTSLPSIRARKTAGRSVGITLATTNPTAVAMSRDRKRLAGGELALDEVDRNRDEYENPVGQRVNERASGALRFFVTREPPIHEVCDPGDNDQGDASPGAGHQHEGERKQQARKRNRIRQSEQRAAIHASEKYDRCTTLASATVLV